MSFFRRFLSRRWLLAFLGVAAVLFGLAMLHPYPRQSLFGPTIRGKAWCVWENNIRRQFGEPPDSLPDKLLRWAGVQRQPMMFDEIFDHSEMLPLVIAMLDEPDPAVGSICVVAIIHFPCLRDRSALPALRRMVNDGDMEGQHRLAAGEAIYRIEKDAQVLGWIVKQLHHRDPEARRLAMQTVAHLADAAPELYPHIVAHAKDTNPSVRTQVMYAMMQFGKEGVPILIDGMSDVDETVRYAAVLIAQEIGPDAKDAIPAIEARLKDADPNVAYIAPSALRAINPKRFQHSKAERKKE